MEVNPSLYRFFCTHHGRARIALVGDRTLVGRAVRRAQRRLTRDGESSRWSHAFLLGEWRPDRRGPGGRPDRNPYIFESDLLVDVRAGRFKNGAQESWVGKWCGPAVEHAAILDVDGAPAVQDAVLGTALDLVEAQMRYPVGGLLRTWLAILRERTWEANPHHGTHAMFCSAFVRHCWHEAGRDVVQSRVALANTAPEHLAQAAPFLAEWHDESSAAR